MHLPGARRFLAARFARGEYLGLHLTVGFMISLGALGLFGRITGDVVSRDPLTQFDARVLAWMLARGTGPGYRTASAMSLAGAPLTMALLALSVGLVLGLKRRWIVLCGWLAAFV